MEYTVWRCSWPGESRSKTWIQFRLGCVRRLCRPGLFQRPLFPHSKLSAWNHFLFACLQGFQRLFSGAKSVSTYLRCLGVPILLYDFNHLLPSLSTDWPAAVFLYYATVLTVEQFERTRATGNPRTNLTTSTIGITAALCAFAVTIKLSSAPILLLLLLSYATAANKRRAGVLILLMMSVVIVPFVARNVVLTGYVLYPFRGVDIFRFDWKMPRTDVMALRSLIWYWAINPVHEWYRAMDMSLIEQVQTWVKRRGSESLFLLPWLCLGVFSWTWVSLREKSRRSLTFVFFSVLCSILLIGIVFCVANAPDARYVTGWCITFGLCPSAWLLGTLAASHASVAQRCQLAAGLLLVASILWMVRHAGVKRLLAERGTLAWTLTPMPTVQMKEVVSEYGVAVRMPADDNRPWNADLPATTPAGFNPWLQMRGQTLAAGFRATKPVFDRQVFEHKVSR